MKKKKQRVAVFLLLSIAVFAAACSPSPAPAPVEEGKNNLVSADAAQEQKGAKEAGPAYAMNPKAYAMEQALMDQLMPLPDLHKGERIGALIITLANPFWVAMKEGYERAGAEMGVEVVVMAAPTEGDTKSQLETLDAMVAKGYAAIIASPIEPFNLVPGVVRANKRGIKVINLGPPINKEALKDARGWLDGRITVNFEEQGALAAEYIVQKLGPAGGKVAIIQGIPGAGQSEGRTAGAKGVFENTKNVEIVSIQPGNWDRNTAYNLASNILQAHPDLKGIFCANDVMALGVVEALQAANKKNDVVVAGVDFIDEARESIQRGELDGTVAMSPFLLFPRSGATSRW